MEFGTRLGEILRALLEGLRGCAERSLKALDHGCRIVVESELGGRICGWIVGPRLSPECRRKNDLVRRRDGRHDEAHLQARQVAKPDRSSPLHQYGLPLAQFSQQCRAGGGAVVKTEGLTGSLDHNLDGRIRGCISAYPAVHSRQILFRGANPVAGIVNRLPKKPAVIVMGEFLCPELAFFPLQRNHFARIKEGQLVAMATAAAGAPRWPACGRTDHNLPLGLRFSEVQISVGVPGRSLIERGFLKRSPQLGAVRIMFDDDTRKNQIGHVGRNRRKRCFWLAHPILLAVAAASSTMGNS
jgi:hypothetical protein